ncbi:MAG: hypothetical protein Q8M29_19480 [Bacteroidota bacterium]|nr:hypothetical protein [Bacteroidota bacterium]
MARFNGNLGVSLRQITCLEETNEVGKDEIVMYAVLIFRERNLFHLTKSFITRSRIFKNMRKGRVFSDFVATEQCVFGEGFEACFEIGNLVNLSIDATVDNIDSARNFFTNPSFFMSFVLLTEHDDSNVKTILSKMQVRVNNVINTAPDSETNATLKPKVLQAIIDAFNSGRNTGMFENSDDRIQIVDLTDGSITQRELEGIFFREEEFGADIPFSGDGGKYELKLNFSGFAR